MKPLTPPSSTSPIWKGTLDETNAGALRGRTKAVKFTIHDLDGFRETLHRIKGFSQAWPGWPKKWTADLDNLDALIVMIQTAMGDSKLEKADLLGFVLNGRKEEDNDRA